MEKTKIQTFNLHFTDFCNYQCKHCFVKKESKELTLEQIKQIVDSIYTYQKEKKIKCRINLAGGEPLASKNIQAIIDYIHQKKIIASIITNGSLLTKEFIVANKNKLSMIGLSIDSFNHQTNRAIGRVCNNKSLSFRETSALCKIIKANNIKLKINCCVSKLNVYDLVPELIGELKADRVKFLRIMTSHLGYTLSKYISINNLEWLGFQSKYKNLAKEVVFEDNKYMKTHYVIIDSQGNLSRDNLHLKNNSVFKKSIDKCLKNLDLDIKKRVTVLAGPLKGFEGYVVEEENGQSHIMFNIMAHQNDTWLPNKFIKYHRIVK